MDRVVQVIRGDRRECELLTLGEVLAWMDKDEDFFRDQKEPIPQIQGDESFSVVLQ
jgi:hypothetical protein